MAMAFALAALLGAGSASASQFRSEAYPATLSGSQTSQQLITVSSGSIKCNTVTLSGQLASATSTMPVTPKFSGCGAFGVKATVSANSCQYSFASTNESPPYAGTLGVACSNGGDAISIQPNGLDCQVLIPIQGGLGTVELQNTGLNANRRVAATVNVSNLEYTESGSECTAPGTRKTGSLTGSYSVGGQTEGGGKQGVYLANEQVPAGPVLLRAESFPAIVESSMSDVILWTNTYTGIRGSLQLNGEVTAASSDVNLTPSFYGFRAFGVSVPFKNNGCYFRLHVGSETAGTVSIVCEKAGSAITLSTIGMDCEVQIPAQANLGSVSLQNTGSGATRAIDVTLNLGGIDYTETGNECAGSGAYSNGSLSTAFGQPLGGYEVIGGWRGGQQGIWLE